MINEKDGNDVNYVSPEIKFTFLATDDIVRTSPVTEVGGAYRDDWDLFE